MMIIDGRKYIEVKPDETRASGLSGVCSQCALGAAGRFHACHEAITEASVPAFGGDCETRDVIYQEVK